MATCKIFGSKSIVEGKEPSCAWGDTVIVQRTTQFIPQHFVFVPDMLPPLRERREHVFLLIFGLVSAEQGVEQCRPALGVVASILHEQLKYCVTMCAGDAIGFGRFRSPVV